MKATTAINLLDAHLRKVLNIATNWKGSSLKDAVANPVWKDKLINGTFGQTIAARLGWAAEKNDTVAKMFVVENYRETCRRWRVLCAVLDARRAEAHGNGGKTTTTVLADDYNVVIEGNEIVEAPAFFFDALAMIDARGIADDDALLSIFNAVEAKVKGKLNVKGSVAGYIVDALRVVATNPAAAKAHFAAMSRREMTSYWKFNQLRNQYAHTGKIAASDRAWLVKFAAKYNVEVK